MILSKLLAMIGLCAPVAPDDRSLSRAMRKATIASWHHKKITGQAVNQSLNIFHQQETDERPAMMLRDAEALQETIKRNSGTSTIEALVREMQGR